MTRHPYRAAGQDARADHHSPSRRPSGRNGVKLPPSGPLSHVRAEQSNSNGRESAKPPAEVNVKVVVIHGREFKGSKQIEQFFTEFGVANYPAYRAGVLGVEDDDDVMLLLVMRGMVPDAVAEVGIEHRHEQVLDR